MGGVILRKWRRVSNGKRPSVVVGCKRAKLWFVFNECSVRNRADTRIEGRRRMDSMAGCHSRGHERGYRRAGFDRR